MKEIWKSVVGYENLYEVSNLGNVKSLRNSFRIREKLLKPSGINYLHVVLTKNKTTKTHTVHRLVATTFISNKNNLPQINHKNCNTKDNKVSNLEWVTPKQNADHAWENGLNESCRIGASKRMKNLESEKNPSAKLTVLEVKKIRYLYHKGNISYDKLAKQFNVVKSTIYCIINKHSWQNI